MSIKKLSGLLIFSVFLCVALYAGLLIYFTWPINEISLNKSGVFGDSFGALTALFSGLAFAGLIITIIMQRDELALQREELNLTRQELKRQRQEMHNQNETLKIQRFENTFFKMLGSLENCRNDIKVNNPIPVGTNTIGRDAVKVMYENFVGFYLRDSHGKFKKESKDKMGLANKYRDFYARYGDELGQYYRTLYNILKFIDSADFIDNKMIYSNLVRAQLSRYELLLFFYNCLGIYGNKKMAPLAKKFNMFKHLEESMLPEENIGIWREFCRN